MEKLETHNDDVKSKMIDDTLWVFSILAALSLLFVSIRAFEIGFTFSYFIQFPIAACVWSINFYKQKLKTLTKTYLLIGFLVLILTGGLSNFGLLASTKLYLILIPVIASFLLSQQTTLKLFIVLLAIYMFFAISYVNGWLQYNFDLNKYSTSAIAWLIDLLLIAGSSWIILRIVSLYYRVLNEQYALISNINEEISDKEEIQRVLFESMNEAVFLLEGNNIINCNKEAKRIFGKRVTQDHQPMIQSLFPKLQQSGIETESIWNDKIKEVNLGLKPSFILNLSNEYGTIFTCELNLNLLELKHKIYYQLIVRDITQRKKKEDELRQYRIELEKRSIELQLMNEDLIKSNQKLQDKNLDLENALDIVNKAKVQLVESEKMASIGILTAGVAHEINNPLNFIKSGIYGIEAILEDDEIKDPEELKNEINSTISKMAIGVEKVAEIVKSLNHFSRNNQTEFQSCLLEKILQNCLAILNHELKNRIAVKTSFIQPDIRVYGNESKLHQVFLNLILNAIQSIEGNGEIEIDVKMHQQEVIIIIKDSGKGIPDEVKSKIFDPFFTTKVAGQGTGLGLSIVLQIIKEHKGDISYDSTLGKGTTVTLILPSSIDKNV
ncbi:MAG: ATP-binding protein [Bacteroidia bacterium]